MKRLIVMSDIHGNIEAMKSVVEDALSTYGSHIDGFVLLGDYCCDFLDGEDCVQLIRELKSKFPVYAISGNRETGMVKPYKEAKDKGDKINWSIDSTMGAPLLSCDRFSSDSLDFLTSLKERDLISFDDAPPIFLQHQMPVSEEVISMLQESGCTTILTAHTHESHNNKYGDFDLFNPGSVGLTDMGVKGACYGVLSFVNGSWSFVEKHCDYDYEAAINRVKSNKLLMEKCKKWGEALVLSVESGVNVAALYMFFVNKIAKMYSENKDIDFEKDLNISFDEGRYANVSPLNTHLEEKVVIGSDKGENSFINYNFSTDSFKTKTPAAPREDWMYDLSLNSIKKYLGTSPYIAGDVYSDRVGKK